MGFDGDTVMVIPTGGKVKINSTPPLKGLEGFDPKMVKKEDLQLELVDHWIYSRLNATIKETESYLQKYALDEAAKSVYEFFRGDFCDWYVEMAKVRLYMNEETLEKKVGKLQTIVIIQLFLTIALICLWFIK